MNEALKILKERRSIREFRPEPLKKEDLDAIVEAGLYAPSAKNLQQSDIALFLSWNQIIHQHGTS